MSADDQLAQVSSIAADKAISELLSKIPQLPPEEVIPFMQSLVVLTVNLMRDGGRQDEYVRGMLDAAIADMAKPPHFTLRDLRIN